MSLAAGRSCNSPLAWQADPSLAQHPWWDSPHHVDRVGASPVGERPRRWRERRATPLALALPGHGVCACVAWEGRPLPLTSGAGWLSSGFVEFLIISAECSKMCNKSTKNGRNAKPILLD